MRAEFIWAVPPAANDNSPFGGGDHIAGYAPLALVAPNAQAQLEVYWVHGNHLGVPIVTTDAQGSVVDPGNDFLRPGFPGQSQVLSDLYYNRNRDYDPVTGRYIQADPIGLLGGSNPYLYAYADPINLIDPTGEIPILIPAVTGGAIGVGIELFSQGFSRYRRGLSVFSLHCYDWGQVALAGAIGAVGGGGASSYLYRFGSRSLTRETGREWSHGLSRRLVNRFTKTGSPFNRALNKRGGLNGSWVKPKRHYKHDPHRWPKDWQKMGDRLPPWLQAVDRIPDWLKASTFAGSVGAAVAESE